MKPSHRFLTILICFILFTVACKKDKPSTQKDNENKPSEQVTIPSDSIKEDIVEITDIEEVGDEENEAKTAAAEKEPNPEPNPEPKPKKESIKEPAPKVEKLKVKPQAGSWIKVSNNNNYTFKLAAPTSELRIQNGLVKFPLKGTFSSDILPLLGLQLYIFDDTEKSYKNNEYLVRKSIPIVVNSEGKTIDIEFTHKFETGTYYYIIKDEGLKAVIHKGKFTVS